MPTEKPRVTFTISKEKLEELERFQHENRIKNQTQAVLALIEKGLSGYDIEMKKSPNADEATPGESEIAMFDRLMDVLVSTGAIKDGKDITARQAEVLAAVCRILDATFQ